MEKVQSRKINGINKGYVQGMQEFGEGARRGQRARGISFLMPITNG